MHLHNFVVDSRKDTSLVNVYIIKTTMCDTDCADNKINSTVCSNDCVRKDGIINQEDVINF